MSIVDADHGPFGFGPGTMILTADGEEPVEWLESGVRVVTRDQGLQKIVEVIRREISKEEQLVEILPGGIDGVSPIGSLRVSKDHHVLRRNPLVELHFATPEVFVEAQDWAQSRLIRNILGPSTLTELRFEHQQIIQAEGVWLASSRPTLASPSVRSCVRSDEAAVLWGEAAVADFVWAKSA